MVQKRNLNYISYSPEITILYILQPSNIRIREMKHNFMNAIFEPTLTIKRKFQYDQFQKNINRTSEKDEIAVY